MIGFNHFKIKYRMNCSVNGMATKLLLTVFSMIFCINFCNYTHGQNIVKVEYYINSNPGFGLGQDIPIIPSPDIKAQAFTVDIALLNDGFNYLYIRAKDEDGLWSQTTVRSIFKDYFKLGLADIIEAEYFLNNDPGYGNGTSIPFTPGQFVSGINVILDINSLNPGFHNLYIRAKDSNGLWSLTNTVTFYRDNIKIDIPNIVKAEYFINTDPGLGIGTDIPITPGSHISGINFNADISSLENGFHHIYLRVKNSDGIWSLTNIKSFLKESINVTPFDIVKAEYFFNIDPGIGNGIDIPLSPGSQLDGINFSADISSLEAGFNHLYIRAKDSSGKWSLTNIKSIYKEIIDNSIADIIEAEYFFNLDPGFGNGTPISISEGSNINVLAVASLSELSTQGVNRLFIRTKDSKGKWSHANIVEFIIDNLVELIASPAEGGTVSGGGWYENNYELTVSANPSEGYYFVSWTDEGVYVTNQKSFTYIVTNHRTLTANFESFVVLIGDVNGDGFVNVLDAVWLISHILGDTPVGFIFENADINGDAFINVADLTALINLVLEITK
jgi:hypothetical protein